MIGQLKTFMGLFSHEFNWFAPNQSNRNFVTDGDLGINKSRAILPEFSFGAAPDLTIVGKASLLKKLVIGSPG